MAALSRGLNLFALPAPSRVALFQSRLQLIRSKQNSQSFCTTFRASYASKPAAQANPAPSIASKASRNAPLPNPSTMPRGNTTAPTPLPRPGAPIPAANAVADSSLRALLARFDKPTLIYEAPRSLAGVVHKRLLALLLVGCGVYFLEKGFLDPPPQLPRFVPWAYAFTSVLLVAFAGILYSPTWNRVLRIVALPASKSAPPGAGMSGLRLSVTMVQRLPFRKKTIVVPAEYVSVNRRMQDIYLRPDDRAPLSSMPVLVRPFVIFGDWARNMVFDLFSGFHGQDWVLMRVKGLSHRLKLDIRGNALGGVKGFDSVVRLA